MSDPDGAVVGRAVGVPLFHESAGSDREFVAAVGVSDLENGAGNGFSLGDEKFRASIRTLYHGEKGHGAVAHAHFHGKTSADFAMVDIKRTDLGFARGDLDMARAVVAEQDDVLAEIGGVVFGKGTSNSKSVHDFHGLGILDLVFAGHGNTSSREQGITKDHGCHDILVLI